MLKNDILTNTDKFYLFADRLIEHFGAHNGERKVLPVSLYNGILGRFSMFHNVLSEEVT